MSKQLEFLKSRIAMARKKDRDKPWVEKAYQLIRIGGRSIRGVAKELQIPEATIRYNLGLLDKEFKGYSEEVGTPKISDGKGPRVLIFDIETSMFLTYSFQTFKANISIGQILEDSYVICWSAKWLNEPEIINSSVHNWKKKVGYCPLNGKRKSFRFNESKVIHKIWHLLNEADIVVAFNGKKFDVRKINAKFFEYGLPEPSPYSIVDPMLICKENFSLTSNKMDWVAKKALGLEGKSKTDLELWIKSQAGDVEALDYMQSYCDQDVVTLEDIYLAVRHWDKRTPNSAIFYPDNEMRCTCCGSTDLTLEPKSTAITGLSKFSVYRCNNCGKVQRDRTSRLNKDKRKNLLMNVRQS